MSYNIKLLDNVKVENKNYFFDANIWLIILKPKINPSVIHQKYLAFFEEFKKTAGHPKIIISTLLLSEIINRYLRDVSMEKYIKKEKLNSITPDYYKRVYRNTPDFKKEYHLLCDEVLSYEKYLTFIQDGFGTEIKTEDILGEPPKGLDFNDHYYYQLARKYGYSIVTDDGDFFVEDVPILTLNNQMYQKAKNSIKPKT